MKVPKNSLIHNTILERQGTNDDGGGGKKSEISLQAPAIRKEGSLLQTPASIRSHALCNNLQRADPARLRATSSKKALLRLFLQNVVLTSGA